MANMKRQAVITVVVDLKKYSKEAHMVTIEKLGLEVGEYARKAFEAKGYKIEAARVTTVLQYVRHSKTVAVKAAKATRHLLAI